MLALHGSVLHLHGVQVQHGGAALLQLLLPAGDAVLDGHGAPVLGGQDGGVHALLKMLQVGVSLESVPDLVAEKALGELEDETHGPGQVEEVDVLVPHGESSLAAAERLGHLTRRPDGDVAPAHVFLVENVGEASDLVLLVIEQGLEGHHVGPHQVAHRVLAGVKGGGLGEYDPPPVLVSLR